MNERRAFFKDLAATALRVGTAAPATGDLAPLDPALERYARQLVLKEWGPSAQARIEQASVLVVGAGALGSPVALYLAAAGVGRLGIVDHDTVELSNLHRQLLHFTPDIGVPKAQSAAAKLGFLNPDVVIEPYQARFDAAMLDGQDLVVDCTDRFATRSAINAACCAAGVALVEGGALAFDGLVMTVLPGRTACYACAFPGTPAGPRTGEREGILGAAAGVVGSLMALEALKLLGGLDPEPRSGFLQLDLLAPATTFVHAARRPGCAACAQVP